MANGPPSQIIIYGVRNGSKKVVKKMLHMIFLGHGLFEEAEKCVKERK